MKFHKTKKKLFLQSLPENTKKLAQIKQDTKQEESPLFVHDHFRTKLVVIQILHQLFLQLLTKLFRSLVTHACCLI